MQPLWYYYETPGDIRVRIRKGRGRRLSCGLQNPRSSRVSTLRRCLPCKPKPVRGMHLQSVIFPVEHPLPGLSTEERVTHRRSSVGVSTARKSSKIVLLFITISDQIVFLRMNWKDVSLFIDTVNPRAAPPPPSPAAVAAAAYRPKDSLRLSVITVTTPETSCHDKSNVCGN